MRPAQEIEKLVRIHYDSVYRFCVRRVGVDRACDAAQETFLTAQKRWDSFRHESSVATWLFGIALNECRKQTRKYRLEVPGLDFDAPESENLGERRWVDREVLRAAMNELSDEHREVVFLHEFEGLTYYEAALILKIPVGTVKSRLHHAFQHLRRALTPVEVTS